MTDPSRATNFYVGSTCPERERDVEPVSARDAWMRQPYTAVLDAHADYDGVNGHEIAVAILEP
jgi:hypothetical protein